MPPTVRSTAATIPGPSQTLDRNPLSQRMVGDDSEVFIPPLSDCTMPYTTVSLLSLLSLAAIAGCSTPPPGLDLSMRRPTIEKKFVVELDAPATPAAINQIHSWRIKLASPDGAPITHAHITVDGGMPQHGHGLPTKPQVTRELADGTYLLEGMKFSMTGWWEIKLAIDSPVGADKVTFNTVVGLPAATR